MSDPIGFNPLAVQRPVIAQICAQTDRSAKTRRSKL